MHQLYYANEVRSFEEVDDTAKFTFSDKERELAERLVEQLSSDEFRPTQYHDEYADRVRAAVDQKVAGQQIVVSAEAPRAQIIDLFEALKKSIAEAKKPGAPAKASEEEESAATPPTVKKAAAGKPHGRKKQQAG
jgi:DNA end-binding protein Ku